MDAAYSQKVLDYLADCVVNLGVIRAKRLTRQVLVDLRPLINLAHRLEAISGGSAFMSNVWSWRGESFLIAN